MNTHSPSRFRITLFTITALVMLTLCWIGGQFGLIGARTLHIPLPGLSPLSIPAGWFILLFAATWGTALALFLIFPRKPSLSGKWFLIIGLALLFRLALLPHEHSDDVYRYLWEGCVVAAGQNPYCDAPASPGLTDLAVDDPHHAKINHPDLPAAYPPFMLLLFSGVGAIRYGPMTIKLLMVAFDMGTLWFILLLLHHRRLAPYWAAIYAFNPIVLYSFAGQGHFDAAHNFFLLGALALYDRKRWGWMFLFAGLAVQSKYVAILALPFLIRRENWKLFPVAIAAILLPYVPFLTSADDKSQVLYCVTHFADAFAFNGSVQAVLMAISGSLPTATTICKGLLAALWLGGIWHFHPSRRSVFRDDPVSGCFFALGALLVLSPTVHFWYLSWIIPFLCIRPSASWMLLTLTSALYFTTTGVLLFTGKWRLPLAAQILEWLPFMFLLLRDIFMGWSRARVPVAQQAPETLSVIIPTLNEADRVVSCIGAARRDPAVTEVIVVDAGSSDNTRNLAKDAGARVILHLQSPDDGGGRGGQINVGLSSASGDIVVVLHADSTIGTDGFKPLLDMLTRQPQVIGGSMGATFDAPGARFRILELANDFRAACMGISFGDQVQFFRREPVVQRKAFPAIPLMEDVELSLRLQRLGRVTFMFGGSTASSRRWQAASFKRSRFVVKIVWAYLWQRLWKTPDTSGIYRKYYRNGS